MGLLPVPAVDASDHRLDDVRPCEATGEAEGIIGTRDAQCQDPDHHDGAAQGLTLPDRSRELRLAGEEAMDAVRRHRGAGEEGADAEALATVATAATAIEVAAGAGTGAAEAGGSDWKA